MTARMPWSVKFTSVTKVAIFFLLCAGFGVALWVRCPLTFASSNVDLTPSFASEIMNRPPPAQALVCYICGLKPSWIVWVRGRQTRPVGTSRDNKHWVSAGPSFTVTAWIDTSADNEQSAVA